MASSGYWQCNLHAVTQNYPSPAISFIHTVPHVAEISRITSSNSVHGHSTSSTKEFTASNVLKDVHIPARLMEDFLELAKDNTMNDLETCGILGASPVMAPEAIAVVMAPTDKSRGYGVFRLSEPGGMSVLRECKENGYHTHREPTDGSPVYEHCSNVYINPHLRLEICDLRE